MGTPARVESRYTVERYFDLVEQGVLRPEDRVELLEGVIVGMSPQNPGHASAVRRVSKALREAVAARAVVSAQLPIVVGAYSVPEPDVAIVPGRESDYDAQHPTTALLVVEIADSSLAQDRLTKTAIYAEAGVPEYWIVNLRERRVEVFRNPAPTERLYRDQKVAACGEDLELDAFPDSRVSVTELFPCP